MAGRIEDYALIGDTQAAGLVGRDGSLDWLCLPRFDSPACFAALLGDESNGRWLVAPVAPPRSVRRRYRGDSLVLETEITTADGVVRVVDCMPPRQRDPDVVRIVEGVSGRVAMRTHLTVRFDYGSIVPWVRQVDGALVAVGGPDALYLWTDVPLRGEGLSTVGEFTVGAGERVAFELCWHPSHEAPPPCGNPFTELDDAQAWWEEWAATSTYQGPYRDLVTRSLLTLKALTYAPTGGIVAAVTTSLPEWIGGPRNWDYRYCWVRDATFTLYSLLQAGFVSEAVAWRDWLLRAVAGSPSDLHIMYGPAGERRLAELELDWLAGYEGSRPVRIGNAASAQFQLDVYGELLDTLHQARRAGIDENDDAWRLQEALLDFLEGNWRRPDEGIWEVRGPRRHFTHSKVMAWVAADRAVKAVEGYGYLGDVDRWRRLRADIHHEVCREGWNARRGAFTSHYGSDRLDASLLRLPLVGFLPVHDPRVAATIDAVAGELRRDGFVLRYDTDDSAPVDGLPPGEGAFLACSFWLADCWALQGRVAEATALFEQLAGLANDVGLLAEEWDPVAKRQLGNFPQALSHVSLVNTAYNLAGVDGPARERPKA